MLSTEDFYRLIDRSYTLQENAANTIWSQLGSARAMIGAKGPMAAEGGKQLIFYIGRNAKSINWIKIRHSAADTYDMEFGRGRMNPKVIVKVDGVYVDQLLPTIEKHTGMYTKL